MLDMDSKGIHQLFLSPLFLLNQILAIIMPGALLILMLGLKGNATLRAVWLASAFGYKTKVAIFLLLAYFLGSALRVLVLRVCSLRKVKPPDMSEWLKG